MTTTKRILYNFIFILFNENLLYSRTGGLQLTSVSVITRRMGIMPHKVADILRVKENKLHVCYLSCKTQILRVQIQNNYFNRGNLFASTYYNETLCYTIFTSWNMYLDHCFESGAIWKIAKTTSFKPTYTEWMLLLLRE